MKHSRPHLPGINAAFVRAVGNLFRECLELECLDNGGVLELTLNSSNSCFNNAPMVSILRRLWSA